MLDIFRHFLSDHLTEKREKRKGVGTGQRSNDLSWCFVAGSNPANQVAVRTYASLFDYAQNSTYWTPNGFYRSDRRSKETLRWLHCIFIDIDDPNLIFDDILNNITNVGLPTPTMINRTPHGYHVYWKITPVRAMPKAIKLYEAITKAVAQAIEGDPLAVGAERFVRIPNNVVYFYPNECTLQEFLDWRNEEFQDTEEKIYCTVQTKGILNHPAIIKLLSGVDQGIRDNTCFTLALAYKAEGYPQDYTLDKLLEWNKKNNPPLPERVVRAKIRSAYSGKYHGPSSQIVTQLSGIKFSYRPVTPPKDKSKRKYRQISEIKNILIKYLKQHGGAVVLSQASLAKRLEVPLSSLKKVIKLLRAERKIAVRIEGSGRGSIAVLMLFKVFIKLILRKLKNKKWSREIVKNCKIYHTLMGQNNIHPLVGRVGGQLFPRSP